MKTLSQNTSGFRRNNQGGEQFFLECFVTERLTENYINSQTVSIVNYPKTGLKIFPNKDGTVTIGPVN